MGRAPGDVARRVAAPALCRFDGGQVGGQAGHVHVVCYFGERLASRVHWFSILGMGLVFYLCCFVQFTLYVSKRSVSVKLYQISQSGSAATASAVWARLFSILIFYPDITNIDLLKCHAMSHTQVAYATWVAYATPGYRQAAYMRHRDVWHIHTLCHLGCWHMPPVAYATWYRHMPPWHMPPGGGICLHMPDPPML